MLAFGENSPLGSVFGDWWIVVLQTFCLWEKQQFYSREFRLGKSVMLSL